ncbi:unnamed protein product [Prorocentrum cordatum]|uniref:Indole-3-glycerol-phosphate synthase n=1 Tax=Prorocentrum cordatum TaxID=2364126 RepID=A0ABN9R2I4_9DINO|nr:unnamed protein product [Polarella glacialis]
MFTDAVFVRNERVARELGAGWAAALMDRCERGLAPPALSRRGQRPCGGRAPTLEGLAVLWCDADPAVTESAGPLRAAGMSVRTFREPEDALEFFRGAPAGAVGAVLTSMMRGGGREARGAMTGLGLVAACAECARARGEPRPVLGVVSMSADREACLAAGADFVVYGDRARAQRRLLSELRERRARTGPGEAQQRPCAPLLSRGSDLVQLATEGPIIPERAVDKGSRSPGRSRLSD